MKAGKLDQSITFQAKSVTRDAMGGEVITWVDQKTLLASVEPLRGREFFAAQQDQSEISIRFVIRNYFAAINSAWRVVWRGVAYEIIGEPSNIEAADREIHIMGKTQQNA